MTDTQLTERELQVKRRLTDKATWKPRKPTYDEIGAEIGITRARVRQIVVQLRAKGEEI